MPLTDPKTAIEYLSSAMETHDVASIREAWEQIVDLHGIEMDPPSDDLFALHALLEEAELLMKRLKAQTDGQ